MTLFADSNGIVTGKFTIPAGIPAGNKIVSFFGGGGQRGNVIFSGQGTLQHQTFQRQNIVNTINWSSPPTPPRRGNWENGTDPLAETFTMESTTQVGGVDLWFVAAPTTACGVQIRETTAGLPNQIVLGEKLVNPSDVVLGGNHTRVEFDQPVLLLAGVEYAIVVLCGDAVGSLSVAEIGKFDATAQKWITDQPFSVGVLLSSSNASTWTAHQDRDMTFRLLDASYSSTTRTISLGSIGVTAATDLMLLSYAERPDGASDVQYTLTLPDGTVITVADGQPVQLAAPLTGLVAVAAKLKGTLKLSPVLHPGTQLVEGTIATTANYVSRAIPGGSAVTVKAVFDAFVPSGATVTVQYKGPDGGDTWTNIPLATTRALDEGYFEFTHSISSVNELTVQIRIILTGSTTARPRVRDLRTFVM